ncbi:uncharacterized protein K460DRAFT_359202 [Cucurbitaria berberidis CBS 394.84]|uniref:Uncharacterized protein n=1 Tax=Cucurbitaria berberidis CBS 394.84 TaxID=1168544 RepID=A0A9P4L5U4_9PLEO|nr:uncharacterized protein K460DRAFT_359202 [Cucurbitaria berberidis CBS 394.84]KAF1842629.1 hypothetical protein K460DRAFT_359202 [Cucurbitaria berberidis CBS 394.84]
MSPIPNTTTRAQEKIPANIILSPRELKHYRRWQHLYTSLTPAEQGYIPTAMEYEEFQQWLKRQDSGYFSDTFEDISDHIKPMDLDPSASSLESPVAAICRHPMHPVTAEKIRSRCPVCTIDVHINYMKVLSQALEAAGGRAPSCTLTTSQHQDTVYSAWSREKIYTLKELSELEMLAEQEAEWLAAHPEPKFDSIQTATKALELYWFETFGLRNVKPVAKKARKVGFTADTRFELGRPQAYYWKRSPRYEPGKYALVEQQEDEEGAISEDSEDYSQGVAYHFGATSEPIREDPSPEVQEPPRTDNQVEELEEDDDDSDWEDIDPEDDSSDPGDEVGEGDHIYFEIEEEASFVVFADD